MKTPNTKSAAGQWWLGSVLAFLLVSVTPNVSAQGIVYGQFPSFSPAYFSYDFQGTRVDTERGFPAQLYDLQLNGRTAYTFYCERGFGIIPSSSNAVLATSRGGLAVALSYGQEIGPDAQGYAWQPAGGGGYAGSLLSWARSSESMGEGFSGYFAGLESAYLGLQFQQGGQTYYGWVRAGAPLLLANGGWIYDYAYETTPNKPIAAGAGVPSTNRFSATFSAANEVPVNRSTNSGTGTFMLNGNTLTYLLKFNHGFRPKAAKVFRPGNPPGPRSLVADLGEYILVNVPQAALYHGEITLSPKQIRELWAGRLNVNFPSTNFPHGELRGQILPVDGNQNGIADYLDSYVEQICPCDGSWKNHAQYVRAVKRAVLELAPTRPVSGLQFRRIVRDAQRSDCGKGH